VAATAKPASSALLRIQHRVIPFLLFLFYDRTAIAVEVGRQLS